MLGELVVRQILNQNKRSSAKFSTLYHTELTINWKEKFAFDHLLGGLNQVNSVQQVGVVWEAVGSNPISRKFCQALDMEMASHQPTAQVTQAVGGLEASLWSYKSLSGNLDNIK